MGEQQIIRSHYDGRQQYLRRLLYRHDRCFTQLNLAVHIQTEPYSVILIIGYLRTLRGNALACLDWIK